MALAAKAWSFRVFDQDTKREIAFKVLRRERSAAHHLSRFVHEAQVTAQLDHPGVIPVYDFNQLDDGTLFYTMRAVRRGTLAEQFAADPGSIARRADWIRAMVQVTETVGYAHSQGVVHRDLKPANVVVGDYGVVMVLDWGLAKVMAGSPIQTIRTRIDPNASDAGDTQKYYADQVKPTTQEIKKR